VTESNIHHPTAALKNTLSSHKFPLHGAEF